MITAGLIASLLALTITSQVKEALAAKRLADARRRESMRQVTEKWHFREWEQDFRSSDTV